MVEGVSFGEYGFDSDSGRRFDRRLDDVFAIQDEITKSVAPSLRGSVLNRREKPALLRPQTATAAYEYYRRGRLRDDPRFKELMTRLE